ncbi:MAG TPA: hypothetical protein VH478_23200 [Trebonia sp.]|nr:hypothetical protein [Trebonia sp.]
MDDEDFNRLFLDFRYTCYRLETLQRYDVSYERAEYDQFLAGEPQDMAPMAEWIETTISKAVNSGKRMQRVHVVEEPLSDYLRYEFAWGYAHTAAAGEDVRIIGVPASEWPADLPHYDYWLFDSSLLVSMHYDDEGVFIAAEVVEDPAKVVQANYWRDVAVALSVSYHDYQQ